MFSNKSVTVIIWANLVKSGTYSLEQVPDLFNLREEVFLLVGNTE